MVDVTGGSLAEADSEDATEVDIIAAANGPRQMSGDEGSVTERSVSELIEATRFKASQQITGPPFGIIVSKLKSQGTVGS